MINQVTADQSTGLLESLLGERKYLSNYVPVFCSCLFIGAVYYTYKKIFYPQSDLAQQMSALANDPNLQKKYSQDTQKAIIEAFQTKEHPQLAHFFVKIFNRLSDQQLNQLLKALFKIHTSKNPKVLIGQLQRLLTLQKIEMVVRSEFANFQTTADLASGVAKKLRREHEEKKIEAQKTLSRTAYLYFINGLDAIINTALYLFNLKAIFAETDASSQDGWQDIARWQAVRENYLLIAGGVAALHLYTTSFVMTTLITIAVAATIFTLSYIYFQKIKPCPEKIPSFRNLTAEAAKGLLEPVFARDKEINELIELLSSNGISTVRKHPLLIGLTRAGKTEIISGLAQRIAAGNVPDILKGKPVFSVNASNLGDFTTYGTDLFETILKKFKGYDPIVFVDEIHTVFDSKSPVTMKNKLKTALDTQLKYFVCATTQKEFDKHMKKEDAFNARCQEIKVEPLTDEQTEVVLSDMVKRTAPDLNVDQKIVKKLAQLKKEIGYENCSQPFTSKTLLSKAFTKVRHPLASEKCNLLQKLIDRRSSLEGQIGITYGNDSLPYSEEGKTLDDEWVKLNGDIIKLENEIRTEQSELQKNTDLIFARNALKQSLGLDAIKIDNDLKKGKSLESTLIDFLLQYHFLQQSYDEAVKNISKERRCFDGRR